MNSERTTDLTRRAGPSGFGQVDERRLSVSALRRLQEALWKQTYRDVWERSPFYRRHFADAGLTRREVPSVAELHRIPTVDKSKLSDTTAAFLCVSEREVVDIVTTSGSTGQPLVYPLTERDLERLAWNEMLSFRCVGLTARDKVVLAVAMDRCFIAGMAYFLGLRKLGCSILRVGPTAPAMHLDVIQRTRPNAIVGVPSFLALLAAKANEAGLDPRKLGLRKAICIGEPVRHPDLSLNAVGMAIERQFGARVFSTYGNTELASSLCECAAGQGGHVHPELLYLETVDDQGRPVEAGQVGEIVATTFGVEGMPLVRYRTGDCGVYYTNRCACGRVTPRLGPIVGRKDQKLKLKGTTIFPSTLKGILDGVPEVTQYVIIARRERDLSDSVEVRFACDAKPEPVLRRLAERFQGEAKVTPLLKAASRDEIERLQVPENSRKRRYFVDLRQTGELNAR